jgi:hypothetical protein
MGLVPIISEFRHAETTSAIGPILTGPEKQIQGQPADFYRFPLLTGGKIRFF